MPGKLSRCQERGHEAGTEAAPRGEPGGHRARRSLWAGGGGVQGWSSREGWDAQNVLGASWPSRWALVPEGVSTWALKLGSPDRISPRFDSGLWSEVGGTTRT